MAVWVEEQSPSHLPAELCPSPSLLSGSTGNSQDAGGSGVPDATPRTAPVAQGGGDIPLGTESCCLHKPHHFIVLQNH